MNVPVQQTGECVIFHTLVGGVAKKTQLLHQKSVKKKHLQ